MKTRGTIEKPAARLLPYDETPDGIVTRVCHYGRCAAESVAVFYTDGTWSVYRPGELVRVTNAVVSSGVES